MYASDPSVERAFVAALEALGAEVQGAPDGRDAVGLVGAAVELRHPHAAETDRVDVECSELAMLHVGTVPSSRRICQP